MSEKLSQGQIDALLKRLASGESEAEIKEESEAQKIREYDFRSPKKFTKERLKNLDGLYENFSRVLSSYLSGLLRVFCEVTVMQTEEQQYFEYSNALPDVALIGMLDMKPENEHYGESTLIMNLSTTAGFLMIDRLLGGSGEGYNLSRDYTDIELAILKNVFGKIVVLLEEVWCNYFPTKIDFASLETNPRLFQVYSPEDTVVITAMNVKFKSMNATLSVCVPGMLLDETLDQFNVKFGRSGKKEESREKLQRQIIAGQVNDSDLELTAVLDQFELNLQDILNLQVSDIIPLGKKIDGEVDIMVNNAPWFSAKLGEVDTKKAVKISGLNYSNNKEGEEHANG